MTDITLSSNTGKPKVGLSHWAVAKAQVGLSYLIIVGFFVTLILIGAKVISLSEGMVSQVIQIVMLPVMFWFQRTRTSGDDPTKAQPPPLDPALPAK